jgi:HEAT repeat protein
MGADSPLRRDVLIGPHRPFPLYGSPLSAVWPDAVDGDVAARRLVADGNAKSQLDWGNAGRFLRPIESARQCEWVLRLVQGDDSFRALTPAQLASVFQEIDHAGADCPVKVARRNVDLDSLAKGCFQGNGLWQGHFVLLHDDSVWEYKYAIDCRCRVSAIHRALVRVPLDLCEAGRDVAEGGAVPVAYRVVAYLDPVSRPSDMPGGLIRSQRINSRWRKFLQTAAHLSDVEARFKQPDPIGRAAAAGELATLPSHAKRAVAEFRTLLGSSDPKVRRAAIDASQELGPEATGLVPELASALGREDRAGREAVCRALGGIGAGAVAALLRVVRQPRTPRAALTALGEIGPAAKDAVTELRKFVRAQDRDLRWSAIDALGEIGPAAAAAVPDLRPLLESPDWAICGAALRCLRRIGPGAKDAVPDLVRIFARSIGPRGQLPRAEFAVALGRIGPAAKAAAPVIRDALARCAIGGDNWGADALERMGERYPPASDPSAVGKVRKSAHWDPESLIDLHFCITTDLLYRLGPWDVPELRKLLRDHNETLRGAAVFALEHLGPDASAAASDIQRLLDDKYPTIRIEAARALAAIRPGPNPGAPAVAALLANGEYGRPIDAFDMLMQLGAAAGPAVGALRGILHTSRDAAIRLGAVRVLAGIGPAAKDALPDLNEIVAHDVWPFTDAAEDAIKAIKK